MSGTGSRLTVLVLGGGPDAEREVSLTSARFVADNLEASQRFVVERRTIDTLTGAQLKALAGDVIFPVLHGGWGEGGPLQDLLVADGRPFVGCGPRAARLAMDKIATKGAARLLGIPTADFHVLDVRDPVCPIPLPVVVKPVHDGSSVGLYVCRTEAQWREAHAGAGAPTKPGVVRPFMIEPLIKGHELTAGILDRQVLPLIEIRPASGLYDYEAKYHRDDTRYVLDPALPAGVAEAVREGTRRLTEHMGVRHIARVDFMLDSNPASATNGKALLLEVNTLPGFTDHSLVPMAAKHAGMTLPQLYGSMVDLAVRDGANAR